MDTTMSACVLGANCKTYRYGPKLYRNTGGKYFRKKHRISSVYQIIKSEPS